MRARYLSWRDLQQIPLARETFLLHVILYTFGVRSDHMDFKKLHGADKEKSGLSIKRLPHRVARQNLSA